MKTLRFNGKNFKLQFWDSAGQEKYKSLIPNYIRGSSIIFAVCDVTGKYLFIIEKKTLSNLENWIKFARDIENSIIVICANKIDNESERKITKQEIENFANEQKCLFFEVSAKSQLNIKNMLYSSIVELPIFSKIKENYPNKDNLIKEIEEQNEERLGNSTLNDSTFRAPGNDLKISFATESNQDRTRDSMRLEKKKCNC